MNSLKRITLWLLATSLVFAAAAMLIPKKALATIAALVFVSNDPGHPVPVSGNVGINGIPTVQLAPGSNVGISGVPAVQVTGTPTVQLAPGSTVGVTGGTFNFSNTPSTPIFTRDIDNPALTPFQTTLCSGFSSNGSNPCGSPPASFTVGANQRFVIEYVSVQCSLHGSASVALSALDITGGGNSSQYSFPLGQQSFSSTFGATIFISNQQTRIYADPGQPVSLVVFGVPGSSGNLACFARLSGNLVTP